MTRPEREGKVLDLLKDLKGLDPLKQLFWSELNYSRVNQPLSRRGWTDAASKALADDPVLFASGGQDNGFHIIYARLAFDALLLGHERLVVTKLLKNHPYSLFVFSNKAQHRWHFINVKYHPDETKRRVFRRITILPNEHYRTAAERISMLDLESIQPELYGTSPLEIQARHDEGFDVEKIGKAFFLGYKEHFWSFVDEIRNNNRGRAHFNGEKGEKNLHRLTQLILGRVLFLYFIQKKIWLNSDKSFLRNLFAPYKESSGSAFYTKCLEPLFFNCLNNAGMNKRIGDACYEIPYLNGGLFEPRVELFEGDPVKGPLVPDRSFRRLFDFLNGYNFTIAESTPIDQDVDIDPEMLGKVFENILAAEDRHASGTYYTPRTIVEFMCRESLFHHLHEKTDIERRSYDDLFEAHLEGRYPSLSKDQARAVQGRLRDIKVLDPAAGSGAFLLGMLHELMHLRAVCGRVLGEPDAVQLAKLGEWKREMIGNNLFGVDNNPEACEIARLRLWLSMVVDEEEPSPLPNLDYRIVEGDTLREKLDGEPILPPRSGPGFETEDDLFRTLKPQGKLYAKERDERTASIVRHLSSYYRTNADAEKRRLRDAIKQDLAAIVEEHWKEHEEHWEREKNTVLEKALQMHKKPDELPRDWSNKLKEAGEHLERIRNEREKFKADGTWPVTPLRLFFAEAFAANPGGFDIVLANPPYVRQEIIRPIKPRLKEEFGEFFSSTADLYTYFYARGLDLLRPGGILCFIAPNKFMRAGYGKNTRKLLTTQAAPKVVIDFGELPVFKAGTDPAIVMVQKGHLAGDILTAADIKDASEIDRVAEVIRRSGFIMNVSDLSEDVWTLDRQEVMSLMKKMKQNCVPLSEYSKEQLYYGIKTGFNEAVVIDEVTKKRLIREDPQSKEVIKPWLRGRDIKKWQAEWARLHLITIASSSNKQWPWTDLPDKKAEEAFARTYPAVYGHLAQFKKQMMKRDDQGEYWWELRSCAYYKNFERAKIIYPIIAKQMRAAYDHEGYLHNDKCFMISSADFFLMAIMNSSLMDYYFRQNFIGHGDPFAGGRLEFRGIFMEQMPVFPATSKQKAPIIKRVEKILALQSSPPVQGGVTEGRGGFAGEPKQAAEIARLEREIDEETYKLYGLTEKEIGIVEGKR